MPIQQDLAMDENTLVGATTCGDKLVLGALQREDSQFVSDKLDVALVGSQHLETMIGEIALPPWGRCVLSKSARRRAKKRQQLAKVMEEETEIPFKNAMVYEESNGTKHVL